MATVTAQMPCASGRRVRWREWPETVLVDTAVRQREDHSGAVVVQPVGGGGGRGRVKGGLRTLRLRASLVHQWVVLR